MLDAAIRLIMDTARQAAGAAGKVQVIDLPAEPDGCYGIAKADGSYEMKVAGAEPRNHRLLRIDQVPVLVEDIKKRLAAKPSVWYSPGGVTIVVDDHPGSNLKSRATLTLTCHEQFKELINCAKGAQWKSPPAFTAWIRSKMMDVVRDGKELLKSVSSISAMVQKSTTYAGDGAKSRESIGTEVDSEMTSREGVLPDEVTFDVRVFDDMSIQRKVPIRCILECNAKNFEIRVEPMAGQLQDAIDSEIQNIGDVLAETLKDVPLYYGTP